jgi:hypothetical protein
LYTSLACAQWLYVILELGKTGQWLRGQGEKPWSCFCNQDVSWERLLGTPMPLLEYQPSFFCLSVQDMIVNMLYSLWKIILDLYPMIYSLSSKVALSVRILITPPRLVVFYNDQWHLTNAPK